MQPAGGRVRLAWIEAHLASAAPMHGAGHERRTPSSTLRVFHMRLKPSRSWSTPLQRMWKLSLRPGSCTYKEQGAASRWSPELPLLAGDNELGGGDWRPASASVARTITPLALCTPGACRAATGQALPANTFVSTEVTASRRRTVCSLLLALLPSAPSIAANDSTANRLKMGSRCLGAVKNRWSKVGSVSGGGSIRRRCS